MKKINSDFHDFVRTIEILNILTKLWITVMLTLVILSIVFAVFNKLYITTCLVVIDATIFLIGSIVGVWLD